MFITSEMLCNKGACAEQVWVFAREWPDGARTTLDNLKRAAELGLALDWLVTIFSSGCVRRAFMAATRERWESFARALLLTTAPTHVWRSTRDVAYQTYLYSIVPAVFDAIGEQTVNETGAETMNEYAVITVGSFEDAHEISVYIVNAQDVDGAEQAVRDDVSYTDEEKIVDVQSTEHGLEDGMISFFRIDK